MKNLILAFLFLTVFVSNAAKNEPAFQPTAVSDCLNTTGALTCAATKPLLAVGAFCMCLNSISTALDGDFGGTLASLCGFYFLGFWAKKLGDNQQLCTNYTSVQIRPCSEALQTVTSISTAVIALGCWGMILQELQKV